LQDVNSLPINFVISWFEQKVRFGRMTPPFPQDGETDSVVVVLVCRDQAVAVFLTMLFLGIKNIRLGPQLPVSHGEGWVSCLFRRGSVTCIPPMPARGGLD
jgi:hypothetical protein